MTTRADYLHALIFSRHTHPCPSAHCKGALRPCNVQFDCQPGPKLCGDCYSEAEEIKEQRYSWGQVDRVLQTAVGFSPPKEIECSADLGHPCDSGPDGEPCADCRATEAEYRREWEHTGRREVERQSTYVEDMYAAGRDHLLRPEERYQ